MRAHISIGNPSHATRDYNPICKAYHSKYFWNALSDTLEKSFLQFYVTSAAALGHTVFVFTRQRVNITFKGLHRNM